ncbi:putative transcriptional regulator, AraC family [Leadbettera azotonutricia ZAS-9]|uniref:Putative transcriptional regulator, AraC family n=1 Tax=Leadbettera azotonutricia (strain ATCC BAA-888 / DSM 13862 / ZAS-9) TaxID=545695 RepID=F5Y7F1_LEAAZ|nr:putative transcriptional regulator, AraC family [Leadbettera azotonutricia ZAS-9]
MELDFSSLPLIRKNSRYSNRKFPLHTLTSLSGHSRETDTSYYNDCRRRGISYYMVLQYTLSGRGRIDLKDRSRDLLPGSLMVLSVPGEQVYYLPEDSEYWEFVFLVLVGRDASRTIKAVESSRGNILDSAGIPRTMELCYRLIQDLFAGKIANPFDNSSRSYELCMALMEETGNTKDIQDIRSIREKQSFEDLLVLMQDNLYRDIPVEEMAAAANLSRSHFTRLFARATGKSPRQYLEELRLKTALDMLCSENFNIKETAAQVGIRDVNYFCRLFKKRFGISPGVYRNRSYWER